jgi:hypothetical protein
VIEMARWRITTPTPGFTGISAGVNFTDGVAEIEGPEPLERVPEGVTLTREQRAERDEIGQDPAYRRLAYFRSAGYGVEQLDTDRDEAEPDAPEDDRKPTRSSSKADWLKYVTSEAAGDKRLDEDDAQAKTRDDLAEHVLGPKEG